MATTVKRTLTGLKEITGNALRRAKIVVRETAERRLAPGLARELARADAVIAADVDQIAALADESAEYQANVNRMADLLADREATLARLREELEKEREESADAIDALRRDLATARLENED